MICVPQIKLIRHFFILCCSKLGLSWKLSNDTSLVIGASIEPNIFTTVLCLNGTKVCMNVVRIKYSPNQSKQGTTSY